MVCQCILVSAHPMFRALPMLPMQDQELESFLHIMKCATVFGMPKLLAYCEYHMALVSLQSPQQGVLIKRCWSEQLSARSLGCIAEGICRAFSGLHGEIVQGPQKTVPCTCECCQIRSNSYRRGGQCKLQLTVLTAGSHDATMCAGSPARPQGVLQNGFRRQEVLRLHQSFTDTCARRSQIVIIDFADVMLTLSAVHFKLKA